MRIQNRDRVAASLRFYTSALQAPFRTGAIAPTSKSTAVHVARLARVEKARQIIELGAGTGVLTREFLTRISPGAKILAIERDPDCAAQLPTMTASLSVVVGCATQLRTHAKDAGIDHADSIVCSLPWSLITPKDQDTILTASRDLLQGKGCFVSLNCYGLHWLPSGRQFKARLHSTFKEVEQGPILLKNCPPVFTYRCFE